MAAKPLTLEEFSAIVGRILPARVKAVAVGVSGGPDSMALAKMLSLWTKKNKIQVHVLTVDHGLRLESAKESRQVAARMKGWPNTEHHILKWKGAKPKTRLMEVARTARYDLMAGYCGKHKIRHLFLAHHQDDQAETFLFRLAKGSGLDGLASIRPVQTHESGFMLVRPFLGVEKERLVATCGQYKIFFVKDPSNSTDRFVRPRLRKSRKVLEEEGLSAKRLSVTAARLERARAGLDEIAEKSFKKNVITRSAHKVVLDQKAWARGPEEISLRVLLKIIRYLRPGEDYLPRMEKIEDLFGDLYRVGPFRKRTLGGLVFERDDRKKAVVISREKASYKT